MEDFTFFSPTKIVFGRNAEEAAGREIKNFGGSRVLLHYGAQSANKSGLLDRIRKSMADSGLFYTELGGVVPNPRLSLVYEGVRICAENNIDFILAAGGGSAIDSAKAIALGASNYGDLWDFYEGKRQPERSMPVGTVPTLAASGSEMSSSSVITNENGWLKRGFNTDFNRPKFSLMNPELTYTLPDYQTACGIVDIMMHTLDRYFSPSKDVDFVDRIGEALLQSVIRAGKLAMRDPRSYSARADLMWAGSISHNTLTGAGKITDFAPHQLEHELSGKYDVAHGAGLSAIWGHWARFVYGDHIMRFAQYATRVWNVSMDFEAPELTAMAGIENTEEYFRSLGMPTNFKGLGIEVKAGDLDEMAEKCCFFGNRTIGSMKKLGDDEIRAIYEAANL